MDFDLKRECKNRGFAVEVSDERIVDIEQMFFDGLTTLDEAVELATGGLS